MNGRSDSNGERSAWTHVAAIGSAVHSREWGAARSAIEGRVPVVLIAGMGVSSRYWIPLARCLATRFDVLAPDLPGFGRSPKPPGARWPAGPSPREQSDQLLAWMDARGVRRAVLCGHSTGCHTVVDFAARFPERVEKLVIAAPPFEPGHRTIRQQLPRLLGAALFELPALLPVLAVEYASSGPLRALQQAIRVMADPMEEKLPRVQAPALVIGGRFDLLASQRWVELIVSRLPRAVLVVVERVGHALHFSSPAATATALGDFIEGRLDLTRLPVDGNVIAPVEQMRRDPLGVPQVIPSRLHGALDYLVAAAAAALAWRAPRGSHSKAVFTATAIASTANNVVSDHRMSLTRKLPMVAHAQVDVLWGLGLIAAATKWLRRERAATRCTVAAIGLYQIASAALTVKRTGPARYVAVPPIPLLPHERPVTGSAPTRPSSPT